VEKASYCGCVNADDEFGDRCISLFQNNSKRITLSYTLNGKEGEINFTAYKGMYDYLSKLPRYISSKSDKEISLLDFKLRSLDDTNQAELLLPLVVEIENLAKNKDDQARIAVSIVQNIPFGNSNRTTNFGDIKIEYFRYPYEVLYDFEGVCGEKSELLAFLLREIGYGSAFLYYSKENHEALGIKCPAGKGMDNTGYCFIETTGPSIISDYKTEYIGFGQLDSIPEIIPIQGEGVFGERNFYEYKDAKTLDKIRERARNYGTINYFQHFQFQNFVKKYGLEVFDGVSFE